MDTNGSGHGALAGFLSGLRIDVLICGGIGGGAQIALADVGIKLYGGVSGEADQAVKALIEGRLAYDPNTRCSRHDQEGGCGGHHGQEEGCNHHGHDRECGGHHGYEDGCCSH